MKINDDGLEKTITKKNKLEKSKEELESKFDKSALQVFDFHFIIVISIGTTQRLRNDAQIRKICRNA